MDRGLISLKFAMLRNTSAGLRRVGWVIGGLLVVGDVGGRGAGGERHRPAFRAHARVRAVAARRDAGAGDDSAEPACCARTTSHCCRCRATRWAAACWPRCSSASRPGSCCSPCWRARGTRGSTAGLAVAVAVIAAVLTWVFVIALSRLTYGAARRRDAHAARHRDRRCAMGADSSRRCSRDGWSCTVAIQIDPGLPP